MGQLLKLCNFYSFMGIWCTQEFYRNMARKGFRLKETSLFLDTYETAEGSEVRFTLIPKEFEPADNDAAAENGWAFLGKNRNFYVYATDSPQNSSPVFDHVQWTTGWLWKPVSVFMIPLAFYYIINYSLIFSHATPFVSLLIFISLLVIYLGYLFSFLLELSELLYLNKYKKLKHLGRSMFVAGLLTTIAVHLGTLSLTLLIVFSFLNY